MEAAEEERQKHRDQNRRLLDAVLEHIPKTLTRADYELLVVATIDRLQYEDWEAVCDRYGIDTDETREPDAAAFELRKKARKQPNHNSSVCSWKWRCCPLGIQMSHWNRSIRWPAPLGVWEFG